MNGARRQAVYTGRSRQSRVGAGSDRTHRYNADEVLRASERGTRHFHRDAEGNAFRFRSTCRACWCNGSSSV